MSITQSQSDCWISFLGKPASQPIARPHFQVGVKPRSRRKLTQEESRLEAKQNETNLKSKQGHHKSAGGNSFVDYNFVSAQK